MLFTDDAGSTIAATELNLEPEQITRFVQGAAESGAGGSATQTATHLELRVPSTPLVRKALERAVATELRHLSPAPAPAPASPAGSDWERL